MRPSLQIRGKDGFRRTYSLTSEDTADSIIQKIKKDENHGGQIKLHFPGITEDIPKGEKLVNRFPSGVTINIDMESDSEKDEHDGFGDGLSNDLRIERNKAHKKATQLNAIVGLTQEVRGRATKAFVIENEANESASQTNATLCDGASFALALGAMFKKQ